MATEWLRSGFFGVTPEARLMGKRVEFGPIAPGRYSLVINVGGGGPTYDVVVTFLAILEMAKMRMMRVFQVDPGAPIHLEYRVLDADDVGPGPAEGEGSQARENGPALDLGGDEGHTSAPAESLADPPIPPERDEAES